MEYSFKRRLSSAVLSLCFPIFVLSSCSSVHLVSGGSDRPGAGMGIFSVSDADLLAPITVDIDGGQSGILPKDYETVSASASAPEIVESSLPNTEAISSNNSEVVSTTPDSYSSVSTSLSSVPSGALVLSVSDNAGFQEALSAAQKSNSSFIRINVSPGTYSGKYSVSVPNKTLQIEGNGASFSGNGASGYWLEFTGDNARLELDNIAVANYANGLNIDSGYTYKNVAEPYSTVYGMSVLVLNSSFSSLGEAFTGSSGFAAIHAKNSALTVDNCIFSNLVNSNKPSNIHGVYVVSSTSTSILNSVFDSISGDPIRLRSSSKNTVIYGNSFNYAGVYGFVTDWYCDSSCATSHSQAVEGISDEPSLSNNSYGTSYSGSRLPYWTRTV